MALAGNTSRSAVNEFSIGIRWLLAARLDEFLVHGFGAGRNRHCGRVNLVLTSFSDVLTLTPRNLDEIV